MIKLQEQPIVTPEKYLFRTWIDGSKIIKTEKGDITVMEILTDFRNHLLQDLEHNKKAYAQKQCAIHGVVDSMPMTKDFINKLESKIENNHKGLDQLSKTQMLLGGKYAFRIINGFKKQD